MAKSTIKMRAKLKDDVTTVKALMSHPMETGLRKDKKTGEKIPAHFIKEVVCTWKDRTVLTANWSGGVFKESLSVLQVQGCRQG
jgi:sulfur-oxidizing protein SoxZ